MDNGDLNQSNENIYSKAVREARWYAIKHISILFTISLVILSGIDLVQDTVLHPAYYLLAPIFCMAPTMFFYAYQYLYRKDLSYRFMKSIAEEQESSKQ